ncbi:MAG TPA: BON domain-containing protein [Vicinamibacteria bacterium]|nr:BON domain-containing protein [Vicinamibacteria bacterium]
MSKWKQTRGSVAGVLVMALLLVLVVIIGVLYFANPRRRSTDSLERDGNAVAENLGDAVQRMRDTSLDAVTTTKVKAALGLSKSVSSFELDVDSDDGRVTLTGTLPSQEAEASALRIAADTSGVVEVIDRIDVAPGVESTSARSDLVDRLIDAELKVTIYETLLDAENMDVRRIRVLVDGGTVTLTGIAPDVRQKELAAGVVAGIEGVRLVVDHLKVAVPASADALP